MYHEPVTLPFCGDCDPDQKDLGQSCKNKECENCTVSFDSLDNAQRTLLHWYNKLDHMGFNQIRNLARRGFLPKVIVKAQQVIFSACQ